MVNPPRLSTGLSALVVLSLTAAGCSVSGCSTTTRTYGSREALPFLNSTATGPTPTTGWRHQLEGKLTDLSVARNSGEVLVSEVLESISENRTQVSLFSDRGSRLWKTRLSAPVRSQAISPGGRWIVLSTYDEELIRLDARTGEVRWRVTDSGICRPIVLEKSSRVLCHHDDDGSPGVVFEVFDDRGQKLHTERSASDSLVLKVSDDDERTLIGFVKGRLLLLDADFRKLWERKLDGEIVDLDVSSPTEKGAFIEAAALVNDPQEGQALFTLAEGAKKIQRVAQHIPLQQVVLSNNGKWLSLYGNGPRGQAVAQYDTEPRLEERWSHHSPRYADYNLRMDLFGASTLIGFENIEDRTRFNHVIAFDRSGAMKWNIPLQADQGAYLYSQGLARTPGMLVVGTDDGVITAFHLQQE